MNLEGLYKEILREPENSCAFLKSQDVLMLARVFAQKLCKENSSDWVIRRKVVVALSNIVYSFPVLRRYAQDFITNWAEYLVSNIAVGKEGPPARKKPRHSQTMALWNVSLSEYMRSLYIMVKLLDRVTINKMKANDFLALKSHDIGAVRWYSLKILCLILEIKENDTESDKLLHKWNISPDLHAKLTLETQLEIEKKSLMTGIEPCYKERDSQHKYALPSPFRLYESIVYESKEPQNTVQKVCPAETDSVKRLLGDKLTQIFVEISDQNYPVCISGPTSCGKTKLLHKAAFLSGRTTYPDVITVQMSDDIDSKILLGSYHTTEVAQEFVWKPGCLTKAILSGGWIIFEDIHVAPSDVIALINRLASERNICVLGYGEIKELHPDFRMFATFSGEKTKGKSLLCNEWKILQLTAYNALQIEEMIISLYPHLNTIAKKITELYCNEFAQPSKKMRGLHRIFTIRDLLKWCKRIPVSTDMTSTSTGLSMFLEAFHLFVKCCSNKESKAHIASLIARCFNLLHTKADYYLNHYKPVVSFDWNIPLLKVGAYSLRPFNTSMLRRCQRNEIYSLTKHSCNLLESLAGCVSFKEPILLIGETGVGKTSSIQYLANQLQQKLVVVNLNRQTDSSEVLGGYKPVQLKILFNPLREEFETIFRMTFNEKANSKFLTHIMNCYTSQRWSDLSGLISHSSQKAINRLANRNQLDLLSRWKNLLLDLDKINRQLSESKSPFAFSFVEGSLIKAIRNGYWILFDEINLASDETLQSLSSILEENSAQVHLWEKNDEPVLIHKNFHLFAAMNPSTDIGKKDLPSTLRNRFTEVYVEEVEDALELETLVSDYLRDLQLPYEKIEKVVIFYTRAKNNPNLLDGMGKSPLFSLRTLCRALKISASNAFGTSLRSLYESFSLSFLTQLDDPSSEIMQDMIDKYIYGKSNIKSLLHQPISKPKEGKYIEVEGFWISQGDEEVVAPPKYIITKAIKKNLKNISRIVSAGKLPILIQGETSVGKTSLVEYLAKITGNKCYRINNHQHTDLQEYIGTYQADPDTGKLVFVEGVLVQAMRKGEWLILDELNLAPSEVLEALNRLLDDNRQLFITETNEMVTAHPRFVLFATQNPPGMYGGRKMFSRAFRNRFVEIHFGEIPTEELQTILNLRCDIPISYCKRMINVLKDLQIRRKSSDALQGKDSFGTLRDLFRWAERYRLCEQPSSKFYDWEQHIADEGYLVIGGKQRKPEEAKIVQEIIFKHFKRDPDPVNLFSLHQNTSPVTRKILESFLSQHESIADQDEAFKHIVWTYESRKLVVIISKALMFKEPLLLVGETGCGKTTIVQYIAEKLLKRQLYSINCHMHSESNDFLGGLRPAREEGEKLFEWVNGPLVNAMEVGGLFLCDEISLADDSVLERLNSLLEPERKLLISEKGDNACITAHKNFRFIGTMNPGGDYGKKELSPALRNRLTEIWCEGPSDNEDLIAIVEHNLLDKLKSKGVGGLIMLFIQELRAEGFVTSIRDILSWINFVNIVIESGLHSLERAIFEGAKLVFLDGLSHSSATSASKVTTSLQNLMKHTFPEIEDISQSSVLLTVNENFLSIGPYSIPISRNTISSLKDMKYTLSTPTLRKNLCRVARAMELKRKPILLEGAPGVGKTTLVETLAFLTGSEFLRINLSEQTDLSDLFGADLPIEGKDSAGKFQWRDGPFLKGLKSGSKTWILLDELNLASQSVLEGLNSCLDHRGEIFIPELNLTFKVKVGTKIFACQNPAAMGNNGGRKQLPKSFMNRFTRVYVDQFESDDLCVIIRNCYPQLGHREIEKMVSFSMECSHEFDHADWDFNLRDLLRWASLVSNEKEKFSHHQAMNLLYESRMKMASDCKKVESIFDRIFPLEKKSVTTNVLALRNEVVFNGPHHVRIVKGAHERHGTGVQDIVELNCQRENVNKILTCLHMGWMPILVGGSGSGKSTLVKYVAQLCCRKLRVITPSKEMDTMDLLGSFEQSDASRMVDDCAEVVKKILRTICRHLVVDANLEKREEIGHYLNELLSLLNQLDTDDAHNCDARDGKESFQAQEKRMRRRGKLVKEGYLKCKSLLELKEIWDSEKFELSWKEWWEADAETIMERTGTEVESVWRVCRDACDPTSNVYRKHPKATSMHPERSIHGTFQWINSSLIKAIEDGDWVLIDGANKCHPAVLDRLNPLMEPQGKLILSERGAINSDKIQVIQPHPNFRIFLAMDPIDGDISRPMKNRGVEIHVDVPKGFITMSENHNCNGLESQKSLQDLNLSSCGVETEFSYDIIYGMEFMDVARLVAARTFDLDLATTILKLHAGILKNQFIEDHRSGEDVTEPQENHIFVLQDMARTIRLRIQCGFSAKEAIYQEFSLRYKTVSAGDDMEVIVTASKEVGQSMFSSYWLPLSPRHFISSSMYRIWRILEYIQLQFQRGSVIDEEAEKVKLFGASIRVVPKECSCLATAVEKKGLIHLVNIKDTLKYSQQVMTECYEKLQMVDDVPLKDGPVILEIVKTLIHVYSLCFRLKLPKSLQIWLKWEGKSSKQSLEEAKILLIWTISMRLMNWIEIPSVYFADENVSESCYNKEFKWLENISRGESGEKPQLLDKCQVTEGFAVSTMPESVESSRLFEILRMFLELRNMGVFRPSWSGYSERDIRLVNSVTEKLGQLYEAYIPRIDENLISSLKHDLEWLKAINAKTSQKLCIQDHVFCAIDYMSYSQSANVPCQFLRGVPNQTVDEVFQWVDRTAFCIRNKIAGNIYLSRAMPFFGSKILSSTKATLKDHSIMKKAVEDYKAYLKMSMLQSQNKNGLGKVLTDSNQILSLCRNSISEGIWEYWDSEMSKYTKSELDDYSHIMEAGKLITTTFRRVILEHWKCGKLDPVIQAGIIKKALHNLQERYSYLISTELTNAPSESRKLNECHPIIKATLKASTVLQQEIEEVAKHQGHRPLNMAQDYILISNTINGFIETFIKGGMVDKIINHDESGEDNESLVTLTLQWTSNFLGLCSTLIDHYWFWDVSAAFIALCSQISVGLSLIGDALSLKNAGQLHLARAFDLCNFFRQGCTRNGDGRFLSRSQNTRIDLMNVFDELTMRSSITTSYRQSFLSIADKITSQWQEDEAARELREKEKTSLYVLPDYSDVYQQWSEIKRDLVPSEMETDAMDVEVTEGKQELLEFDIQDKFIELLDKTVHLIQNHWIARNKKWQEAHTDPKSDLLNRFVQRYQMGFKMLSEEAEKCTFFPYVTEEQERQFMIGAVVASHIFIHGLTEEVSTYDIYSDPNVIEVKRIVPVFQKFRQRVDDLLEEWPDFPTLKRIQLVMDRIQDFKIDEPLMKFLIGLEMVLETAQEWELNSHQGVSLSSHLVEISNLIICWRKMELSSWKHLLERQKNRYQRKTSAWFYRLNMLVKNIFQESEIENNNSLPEFILTLEKFMESCTLGQFESRLNALYQLHCYIFLKSDAGIKNSRCELIAAILWNLYSYYKQFLLQVQQKMKSQQSPVEKGIKEFIKINRWNDGNYFSLRESVLKSHKTLNNFLKEFDKVLSTPAAIAFEDKFEWSSHKIKYKCKLRLSSYILLPVTPAVVSLKRSARIKILIEDFLGRHKQLFEDKANDLAELRSTISEQMLEFERSNSAIPDGPYDRRKKMLHQLHSQKRASLAQLFKTLKDDLSLSFQRGNLIFAGLLENSFAECFTVLPVDVAAGWNKFLEEPDHVFEIADRNLSKTWNDHGNTFFKCIRKVSMMSRNFDSPSKELGPQMISKCKGYVGHLLHIVTAQRKTISSFSEMLWYIRSSLCEKRIKFNFKSELVGTLGEVASLLTKINVFLGALSSTSCEEMKLTIGSILKNVAVIQNEEYSEEKLKEILKAIDCLTSLKEIPIQSELKTCKLLVEQCFRFKEQFKKTFNESGDHKKEQLLKTEILITYQKLNKILGGNEEGNEEGEDHKTFYLKEMKCFNLHKVLNWMKGGVYHELLPQYILLAQLYLTYFINIHGESTKLLSHLAKVFHLLAEKGFCLPSDYEEEAREETEQIDPQSGMGLGNGDLSSGAQDVSDRLESEDQVEETFQKDAQKSEDELSGNETEDIEESQGIDMAEEFGGKAQNFDKDGSDSNDADENEELDKEMGDVDDLDAEKLDDQLWGGSSDEEDSLREEKCGEAGGEKINPKKAENMIGEEFNEEKEYKGNEKLEDEDEEVDDDQKNPYHGQQPEQLDTEDLELPENMDIDENEVNENPEAVQENPYDLDNSKKDETEPLEVEEFKDSESQEEIKTEREELNYDEESEDQEKLDFENTNSAEEQPEKSNVEEHLDEEVEPEENQLEDEQSLGTNVETKYNETSKERENEKFGEKEENGKNSETEIEEGDAIAGEDVQETDNNEECYPAPNQVQQTQNVVQNQQDTESSSRENVGEQNDEGTEQEDKTGSTSEKLSESENVSSQKTQSNPNKNRTQVEEKSNSKVKKLPTIENIEENKERSMDTLPQEANCDLYEHVADAQPYDKTTLDDATKEQAENQHFSNPDLEPEVTKEEEFESELKIKNSENLQESEDAMKKKRKENEELCEEANTVQEILKRENKYPKAQQWRFQAAESKHYTKVENFDHEIFDLCDDKAEEKKSSGSGCSVFSAVCLNEWREVEKSTQSLAQTLCEQLRLILEPTQASRLKGDYKTGKRLNMRKVIPYIASGFRKDKIWLRRTQPSKREYKILLALDDSASMSDNQSRQMALASVSVLSQALNLLEAGDLSVVSFGEEVTTLHDFQDQFNELSGMKIIQQLKFSQKRTRIAQLLKKSCEIFSNIRNSSADVGKLLIIISDGRAVCHEGANIVKKAIVNSKEAKIFTVFIIVDNPTNKDSILDIKQPVFHKEDGSVTILNYMDNFPFPFYIILRDLGHLPSVLSDALKQWFTLFVADQ